MEAANWESDCKIDVPISGDIDACEIDGCPLGERAVIINRKVVHDLAHIIKIKIYMNYVNPIIQGYEHLVLICSVRKVF